MIEANTAQRVRDALFGQKYNLLLGAGVSLDSTDRYGKELQGAEDLRKSLCALTGSRESSPLWRVAGNLTPAQVDTHLTQPYHGCKAGFTLKLLTRFAWRTAFTLNIDDALENAYEGDPGRLQSLLPVNYTRTYETFRNPQELPLIHLHGSVRYPNDRYIFSLQEYASVQRGMNAWVHMLSGLIISEPFIIAGTTLFEPDLEYFLAHRPSNAPVISRAPSILVEPFPDAGTRKDCEKLNLILVEAGLHEFLSWLAQEFGNPPSPLALREPIARPRVSSQPSTYSSAAFWSDFDFVAVSDATTPTTSSEPSAFAFGRPPSWDDIRARRDVLLQDQLHPIDEVRRWHVSNDANQFVCLVGRAGSGKSTTIRRIAVELAAHGIQVFYLKATAGFDVASAFEFLSLVEDPIVLVTDSLAEHGDQLADLVAQLDGLKRLCVLGTERQYRMRLVREFLADLPYREFEVGRWRVEERTELIRRYSAMGIVGTRDAIADPRQFAAKLSDDTVAEAACRILNDFRPLRTIVRSLWNDTLAGGRPAYLAVALAYYCHPVGIRRDIVSSLYHSELIEELAVDDAPLRLATHPDDTDYLVPANPTLAALLIEELSRIKPQRLLEITAQLANGLAPFVTRHTIKQRTPEARLAGRLFDADGAIPEVLKDGFDTFYELTLERWKWNSRYWEQRALWVGARDRLLSIQHARQAVAIERHPFPMTTLANVLFCAITETKPPRDEYFAEALSLMKETIRIESNWERGRTRKAYWVLLNGVADFKNVGGTLTPRQSVSVERAANDALRIYAPDSDIHERASDVLRLLTSGDS
ncbi:SIR2 family protein [Thauera sp.]|uniref:P-loop NTPase n=1 Tax=Thauera sp. TaxID=1905334 RepID=UPI002C25466C|nr:SIR2 family protein [Thauera sp.]HRO37576.1 SIR2 family protein [Thauera sp.]